MNKIIVLSFLLPFVSTYTLTPLSIDMEQELITIFDCNFYNNIIEMDFIVNDIHTNITVNQKNYAIYVTITSNNSMNKKYNFGIINICSDSYKKIICNMEQCMSDKFYRIKINSTLYDLEKMISYINYTRYNHLKIILL
jgi:hypothetical protein